MITAKKLKKANSKKKGIVLRKVLIGKSLPIKDVAIIEQIKELYRKDEDYRGLLAFVLAINTGLKVATLLNLKVGDVLNRDILSVIEPNSRDIMTFVLTKEVKEIVPYVVADRKKSEALFASVREHKLDRGALYRDFQKICTTLNVADKYSLLSWRKTFAYHYYQYTGDIAKLMYMFHFSKIQSAFEFIDEEQNLNLELDRKFAL